MPLYMYPDVYSSGSVPAGWAPVKGGAKKYPVDPEILAYLRTSPAGRRRKVIKKGIPGDVHYFEHASGRVAGVKYYP